MLVKKVSINFVQYAFLASWMAPCTAAKIYAVQFVPEESANS